MSKKWWHPIAIPILKAMTTAFSSLARWAGDHPGAIVEIATMLAAGVVAAAILALAYIIVWII
jgi:hypothetical protein